MSSLALTQTSPRGRRLHSVSESLSHSLSFKIRLQKQSPGFSLRLDDLLLWSDHGLAKWSMMDPKGGLIMHGYDAVTYDAAGHIQTIVGFFDVPAQRAAPPPR